MVRFRGKYFKDDKMKICDGSGGIYNGADVVLTDHIPEPPRLK